MRSKLLLISSLLLLPLLVWSQKVSLTGVVYDESKQPIPMVNILVSGTSNGALSGFDGTFSISLESGQQLEFSFLGYEKQFITYTGQKTVDVVLKTSAKAIDEVIVIGYGEKTRKDLLGSVSNVSGLDLRKTGITNVSHMIQDALPGVFAEISSGQPGADDAKITVRGASSWNGDNSPLILVDGIEAVGGFSQVDPSEIASISVLKDAASTAIYGVRGANGVILITTRRGGDGRPNITVSANVTAKMVADVPDQLGAYDVLMLGQESAKNGGDYAALRSQWYIDKFLDPTRNKYAYPDIDWYEEMVKTVGWENSARVNLSGGTEFVKYFASVSNTNLGDVIKNDAVDGYYDPSFSYNKTNFRSNLDFTITPTTQLRADISGRVEYRQSPNADVDPTKFSNVFKFIDEATPYLFPLYYPAEFVNDSAYNDPLAPDANEMRLSGANNENPYQSNPYNVINYSGMRKYRKDVVDITLGLDQDLSKWVQGLRASAKFNYSSYYQYKKTEGWTNDIYLYDPELDEWRTQRSGQIYNTESFDFHSKGGEGYNESRRSVYYEGRVNYDRSFKKHNIGFVGVFNRKETQRSLTDAIYLKEDWAGRLSYDYAGKYYVKLSAGYNGTDTFMPGRRFGFFPSAALAWNIAEEKFFKETLGLKADMLKLRYSYGKTGSEDGGERYMYMGGWNGMDSGFSYRQFGSPMANSSTIYGETKIPNPYATWESSYKQNLGLDIVLLNNDLDVSIDAFDEQREDIFLNPNSVSYYHPSFGKGIKTGKVNLPKINEGMTKNHGIELDASYGYTLDNGMRLKVGGNMTAVESRIIYKNDKPFAPDYQKQAGKPLGWQKGYQTNGYVTDFEQAVNAPNSTWGTKAGDYSFVDFNGNGEIESNDEIPLDGNSQPMLQYSFRAGFNYKGFDLSVKFFGKEGVYYNASNLYPNFDSFLLEGKTMHLDTWSPSNTNATYPTYRIAGNRSYTARSSVNLFDASYLKLHTVSMSYMMKSDLLKRLFHIESTTFALSGQNLYTWTKVPIGDPEGGNAISGTYGGSYPMVRRFIFDLKLIF